MVKRNQVQVADSQGTFALVGRAADRMSALENQAEDIHTKTNGSCRARVLVTSKGGLQALVTDGNTTIEINRGAVSVAVRE